MKLKSLLYSLLLLPSLASAQILSVYCINVTSTPCVTSGQVGNGTQGDPAWLAFGKINSSVNTMESQILALQNQLANPFTVLGTVTIGTWNASVITAPYGGSGVAGTLTGPLYGNGSSAYTVATSAQIAATMSGHSSSCFFRGDGVCAAPSGSGTVTGTGTAGYLAGWTATSAIGQVNLTGDCTTSGTLATSCNYIGGEAVVLTAPVVFNGSAPTFTFKSNTGDVGTLEILQKLCPTTHTFSSTGISDTCTLYNGGSDGGYSDSGMQLYHAGTGAVNPASWTGPSNSVDSFPVGTTITIMNEIGGGAITITPTDTLIVAGTGVTGTATTVCPSACTAVTLTLTANKAGMITMVKTGSPQWFVNGVGFTTP
jgi:hypothetical protein